MRLVPYWPYEFARTGETADSVRVTHWTGAGPVSATVDRRQPRSVGGVVDILSGPDHEHWLAETGLFGFRWPEGFDLGVTATEDDDKPFYLFGPDGAQIFPQGPVATERLPDAAGWTAPGQTLVAQRRVDDIDIFELTYEHGGTTWWQTHWAFPVGAGKSLVMTGQTPIDHKDLVHAAIQQVAGTLRPTQR